MKKLPLILLLFLLSLVIASALVHQEDSRPHFEERRGEHGMYPSRPLYDGHKIFDRPFGAFLSPISHMDEMMILEDNIIKAESIIPRLGEFITLLEGEGNDVERMEVLLHEYSLLVKDARLYFELANNSESPMPENGLQMPDMTEQEYQELSRKSIMQSNMLLKNIFDEFKPYISGRIVHTENRSFIAQGSGMVMLSGAFDVNVSVLNGKMSYMDIKKDHHLKFEDGREPQEITASDPRQKVVFYDNVSGNVTFSGSGYNLAVFGDNISLSSRGTGGVQFFGKGYYYFTDTDEPIQKQLWVPSLFENN
ncbi:hypothetical protein V7O66_12555 [Methanolobus sp. ZRKC3]|uniref:hypothetical protein n=1 Tax=Methanolobus sp. ZRKC3 TaxID=3125786 RepID=UPI0032474ACE